MEIYNVIVAPSFEIMLTEVLYRNKYYSNSYTNNILNKTYVAISVLETFPYATPSVKFKDKQGEYRKYVINNRFLIIFKIEQNNVCLLYFVDARMRYENYFKIHVD